MCLPKKRADYWLLFPVTIFRYVLKTFSLNSWKLLKPDSDKKNKKPSYSIFLCKTQILSKRALKYRLQWTHEEQGICLPVQIIQYAWALGGNISSCRSFFWTKMIKIKQFCLISITFKNNFTLFITRIFKFWLVWNIFCMFCVTCTKLNLEGVLDFNIHWGGSGTFVIINSKIVFSLFLVSRTV